MINNRLLAGYEDMSEQNTSHDQEKKSTLTLKKTLSLSKDSGKSALRSVRDRGRVNKMVMVEVKKKRFPLSAANEQEIVEGEKEKGGLDGRGLTASERDARFAALQLATREKEEKKEKQAQDTYLQAADSPEHALEEEVRHHGAGDGPRLKEEEKVMTGEEQELSSAKTPVVKVVRGNEKVQDSSLQKDKFREDRFDDLKPTKSKRGGGERRRSNKLTVAQALSEREERMRSMASIKRAREKAKRSQFEAPKDKLQREIILPEVITVQELANRMAERAVDVVKILMKMGIMITAAQSIDADTAEIVASEFGHTCKRVTEADVEKILFEDEEDKNLVQGPRSPIVTVMGHVDHGKTSLLDAIRQSQVADKEAGGITQHIGAYQVYTTTGQVITFIDTPGHEAFTAMRSRGAKVTDIVVLVVAADDGIMAQTVEAINHARAANVPIIVAINKIDKPGANIQRIRNELLEHKLVPEELGGDTLVVEVSAKQRLNLDTLLEVILLQAEVLELRAATEGRARGVVIESRLDKEKGVVATLLIQKGTLEPGDLVVAGKTLGKIKTMRNAEGHIVEHATPSMPVEVLGFDNVPDAGDEFVEVTQEKQAREIAEYRIKRERDLKAAAVKKGSLEDLFHQIKEKKIRELPVVIKADVAGSLEAITGSFKKLPTEEVKIRILHQGVGGMTESDINLAKASQAMIVGFNVRADNTVKAYAAKEGVELRFYTIIYDLVNEIKDILSGMLAPKITERALGTATIRQVFTMSKVGKVAGAFVTDGIIKRGADARLLRDNIVIHQGKIKTLRRFKDDVKEVGTNFECGLALENYEDVKEGDVLEVFEKIEEKRQL